MLTVLVGTGVYLTIRTRFLCWRNLGHAIGNTISKEARQTKGEGDVSPFAALCTALAATIGTGNIAGVASALAVGGPGALVWMWRKYLLPTEVSEAIYNRMRAEREAVARRHRSQGQEEAEKTARDCRL